MSNINIKAVLGTYPMQKPREFLVITRGASAELNYNLIDKWFDYDQLEQLTFAFKQGKKVFWYKMFEYFALSADEEVIEGKIYYNVIPANSESRECIAEIIEDPSGSPHDEGYFEAVEIVDYQNEWYYMIDPHFKREFGDGYDYISFILTPENTKLFKSTGDMPGLEYETTVRLNTDMRDDLAYRDSVVVEPQPPIAVADSLYSNIK